VRGRGLMEVEQAQAAARRDALAQQVTAKEGAPVEKPGADGVGAGAAGC
jgi:hypothetical protein